LTGLCNCRIIAGMETRGTKKEINVHHIDVLDGIRALSIGLILWFHLWQQSWLMPVLDTPFLGKLGLSSSISLDFIPRGGFLFVDLMLLLSAFCLFLPHARAVFLGEPAPEIKGFYSKRAARILPCYYLCVLIIFFGVALPSGAYASSKQMLTELFSTLTFTQVFFPQVLLGTRLNGVLWTAAIEMQFYLIFPLLAWCFRKRPLITYLAMTGVSLLYLYGFALPDPEGLRVTLNQLPGFMGVFANGMLAAYGFVWLSTKVTRRLAVSIPATLLAVFCLGLILYCEKVAPRTDPVQVWQASNRFSLSLLFALFIISSAFSARWFRFLLGNRAARFLAGISYNVYIWHQWLFVKLKDWRIPFWQGDTPPNFLGDLLWQRQYTLICVLAALGVAIL
jgi:peptidoglycan/LPS O-acetylase OafA/YrhL